MTHPNTKEEGQVPHANPNRQPSDQSSSDLRTIVPPLDLATFWQEHDRALPAANNPDDVTLPHDLYRGMPSWFNAYYAHFQRRVLIRFLWECNPKPGTRSLDVGCGTGRWAGLLLKLRLRAFGVDVGARALQYAARRWPSASFSCGGLPHLGFADDSFELVVCITVLQCISREKQPEAIREIARVLRQGGYLLMCETIDTDDPSPHVFGNKPERWLEMLFSAGFQLIAQSACEYLPHVKLFHWARRLGGGTLNASHSQTDVSQVAELLRTRPLIATAVRLAISLSYPLEYLASWILPQRWARFAFFLIRKS